MDELPVGIEPPSSTASVKPLDCWFISNDFRIGASMISSGYVSILIRLLGQGAAMRLLLTTLTIFIGLIASGVDAASKADEAVIEVFSTFIKDWDMPGFPGLEAIMTPDVDFVVVTGRWLKGRDEVVAYHRDLLKTFYAGSHLSVDDIQVRFVDTNHAIVHFASTVHYMDNNKPVARPSLATATLVKSHAGWLIDTFQNTITGGPGYMFESTPIMPNHN